MLVLTRSIGERLFIGDDIKITVLRCTKNQVRLGIDAPSSVPVHREEVFHSINKQNDLKELIEKEARQGVIKEMYEEYLEKESANDAK